MKHWQRKFIHKNIRKLIENTTVDCTLVASLCEIDALSPEESKVLRDPGKESFQKSFLLYDYIKSRDVYDDFIRILLEQNQSGAAKILQDGNDTHFPIENTRSKSAMNINVMKDVASQIIKTANVARNGSQLVTDIFNLLESTIENWLSQSEVVNPETRKYFLKFMRFTINEICDAIRQSSERMLEEKLNLIEKILQNEVEEHRIYLESKIDTLHEPHTVTSSHHSQLQSILSKIRKKLDFPVSDSIFTYISKRLEEKCELTLHTVMKSRFCRQDKQQDIEMISALNMFITKISEGIYSQVSERFVTSKEDGEWESKVIKLNSNIQDVGKIMFEIFSDCCCKTVVRNPWMYKLFKHIKQHLSKLASAAETFFEYDRLSLLNTLKNAYLSIPNTAKRNSQMLYNAEFAKYSMNIRPFMLLKSLDQKLHSRVINVALSHCNDIDDTQKLILQWNLDKKFRQRNFFASDGKNSEFHGDGAVLGIDFGTHFFRAVVFYNNETFPIIHTSEYETPCTITISEHQVVIGERRISRSNKVFEIKQAVGRTITDNILQFNSKFWPFTLEEDEMNKCMLSVGDRKYCVEDMICLVLKDIKQKAEKLINGPEISTTVIAIPPYYTTLQRACLVDAANSAGIKLVKLLNESLAASYSLKQVSQGEHVIFDFGAGRFTMSIVDFDCAGTPSVLATGGVDDLGGINIDQNLAKFCLQEFDTVHGTNFFKYFETQLPSEEERLQLQRLLNKCEKCKKHLTNSTDGDVYIPSFLEGRTLDVTVTREQFNNLNGELFTRIFTIVDETMGLAGKTKENIKSVILIGGSTRIVKVQNLIKEYFGNDKINVEIQSTPQAVAYGAAVYLQKIKNLPEEGCCPDRLPLPLFMEEVVNNVVRKSLVIVNINEIIPREGKFVNYVISSPLYREDRIEFRFYQGHSPKTGENYRVGNFILDCIHKHDLLNDIQLQLEIDNLGCLNLKCLCGSRDNLENRLRWKKVDSEDIK